MTDQAPHSQSASYLQPHVVIADKYRLEAPLAEGAMKCGPTERGGRGHRVRAALESQD